MRDGMSDYEVQQMRQEENDYETRLKVRPNTAPTPQSDALFAMAEPESEETRYQNILEDLAQLDRRVGEQEELARTMRTDYNERVEALR